jgi:hypothetical protein
LPDVLSEPLLELYGGEGRKAPLAEAGQVADTQPQGLRTKGCDARIRGALPATLTVPMNKNELLASHLYKRSVHVC